MPDALASRQQGHLAGRTAWPFSFLSLRPIIFFSFYGTFLNEMRFQLADQFPSLHFYFQESRLGVGYVPRIHFSQDFITELFEAVLVFHFFLCCFLCACLSFQKDDALSHLSCLS